ncbi:5-guanidino-2-oxopentanoate decarboxylase [Siculibacillus lacustris]|uniref:5-guanidino-2-oxopentanoate decarboxylase n=1 Tax=Siculibacillus lacustris TaxID=1549641 RepID=A0A4Q9VS13_9HYPH|nr:5-guanidino-2-oxopentanoate decarboxylase [Siculibacillus lacustris]TBW38737.1 5-guanidino-2-oxopentanoate decarboxylase [Siculibacillus lacustris]
MSPTTVTCGERLVQLLEAYGIDTIFGIPGIHTVELYRGLPATRIRHVTPRHEQGAGFMADGYARACGRPAAAFIVTGPGMTNIATAMGQAYADSVPMLVISAVTGRADLGMGRGKLHELPSQRALIAGVSAFSHTLLDPEQLPEVLARAFAIFAAARPRPVHIEIPIDVIVAPVAGPAVSPPPRPFAPGADARAIEQAAIWLAAAQRPLIVAGGGAVGAARAIRGLAERLDAPLFTTVNAKGILPPDHPLGLSGNLALAPLYDELAAADVVLAIGTEFGETEMYPDPRPLTFGGRLIRIDIDPEQTSRPALAALSIVADARIAAEALLARLGAGPGRRDGAARAADLVRRTEALLWPACRVHAHLFAAIDAALPDAIVVGDQTEPVYAGNQIHRAPRVRSFFNASTGYGTLGYALPAAFGAKLAAPERAVVCVIGDGGLQFTAPELASAVDAGIGVAVIVWNNQAYGEIKTWMRGQDLPTIGVDIGGPRLDLLAEAHGCAHVAPDRDADLVAALAAAAAADVPTLIEIRADGLLARSWGAAGA